MNEPWYEIFVYLEGEIVKFFKFLRKVQDYDKDIYKKIPNVLQEYIISHLFKLGLEKHMIPFPEYRPFLNKGNRIDLVWFSYEGLIDSAFEVGRPKMRDIKKLLSLGRYCDKYIIFVNKDRNEKFYQLCKYAESNGIKLLDLSWTLGFK